MANSRQAIAMTDSPTWSHAIAFKLSARSRPAANSISARACRSKSVINADAGSAAAGGPPAPCGHCRHTSIRRRESIAARTRSPPRTDRIRPSTQPQGVSATPSRRVSPYPLKRRISSGRTQRSSRIRDLADKRAVQRRSALDGRQIESAETLWIGQDVYLHDLPSGDRETDHGKHAAVGASRDEPQMTVDQDELIGKTAPRERLGLCGDGARSAHDP